MHQSCHRVAPLAMRENPDLTPRRPLRSLRRSGLVPIVRERRPRHSDAMDQTDQLSAAPVDQMPPDPAATEATPLRRSVAKRMIGGVAGGIAERFDIDVSIVRVAFVVLTLAWGLGAAIYLAMWALVPPAGQVASDGTVLDEDRPHRSGWLIVLLVAAAICVGLLFATPKFGGPALGGGIGLSWLLFLVVLLVLLVRRPIGRFSLGRLLGVLALIVLSVFIVAVGAFFGVVAMTGVPLAGGIGDRVWQPTSVAQVQPVYRTAIGNMTVDLRQVPFRVGTTHVTATVGVGRLLVEVPSGVVVDVTAHSGIGDVTYVNGSPEQFRGTASTATTGVVRRQLVLVAEAGVGQVQLYRGG